MMENESPRQRIIVMNENDLLEPMHDLRDSVLRIVGWKKIAMCDFMFVTCKEGVIVFKARNAFIPNRIYYENDPEYDEIMKLIFMGL